MSSDIECDIYDNFKKFRKLTKRKIVKEVEEEKKAKAKTASPKVKKMKLLDDSDSDCDFDKKYREHIKEMQLLEKEKEEKEKKQLEEELAKKKALELETKKLEEGNDSDVQEIDPIDEEMNKMNRESRRARRRERMNRITDEVNDGYIENLRRNPYVFALLRLTGHSDFEECFKFDYKTQLAEILIKYAPMAGFGPNDVHIMYENDTQLSICNFWDTPEKLEIPPFKICRFVFAAKKGVKREIRAKGDIKIKINLESQRKPLLKLIHKDTTFGVFKETLAVDLNVKPSQLKIIFDAEVVVDTSTPTDLDMVEEETIDVIILSSK